MDDPALSAWQSAAEPDEPDEPDAAEPSTVVSDAERLPGAGPA
jgi:hypothetical protein